jgi:arsenite/tail-anchored protein-transporting ATPase
VSRRARWPVDALVESLAHLTLVAGKGGVGKTTTAAALALVSAERGRRTLLLSTDPAGTLGDALGIPLAADPMPIIGPGGSRGSLDAFQIDASAERHRFLERWRETIVTIIDRGTYLDLEDITGLVDAVLPGADEVFAVLRLGELEQQAEYDRIIIDTAPTGHTLRLLDLPRTFGATIELLESMQSKHRFMVQSLTRTYRADAADAFLARLRGQVVTLSTVLRDPTRAAALLVTRLEPLVIAESERYAAELAANGIRLQAVIVNRDAREGRNGALPTLPDIAPEATRYVVPELGGAPVGVDGLRRWAKAVVAHRAAEPTKPDGGTRARAAAKRSSHRDPRLQPPTSRHPSRPAQKLLARSLTIVGGKGGVGKTTTACALAIQAAQLTSPTLIVSTDPAPSIADALEQPIGDEEMPVLRLPGLFARQMDAPAGFREFQRGYQCRIDALFDGFVRHGVDATHDRAILRDLLALSPPGIDELYALASLGETVADGRFAHVIVDPAPTGHLLRLLQMPALALDWSHRLMRLMLKYREVAGLGDAAEDLLAFARRARHVRELLRDPDQAGLVVVSLDEPLVRGETARLVAAARAEGLNVRGVVWNRWSGTGSPVALPVTPPVTQFVAPVTTPPPIGAAQIRAWTGLWSEVFEADA